MKQEYMQAPDNFQPLPTPIPLYRRAIYFVLRNPWISLTAFLLILAIIFVLLTPEQTPVTRTPTYPPLASPTTELGKLQTVLFTGTQPELPEQATIYKLQPSISGSQRAEALAAQLGMKKIESEFVTYLWQNLEAGTTLQYDELYETIRYSVSDDSPETSEPARSPILLEQAIQVSQAFIANQIGITDLVAVPTAATFFSHEGESQDPTTAEAVTIPFQYQVDGIPVKYGLFTKPFVEITVNSSYTVVKAVFYPTNPQPTSITQAPLVSIEQAVGQIRTGKTTVSSATFTENSIGETIEMENVVTLELSQVVLEYRIGEQTNILAPYFLFSGTALTDTNDSYSITILTPAIEQPSP